MRGDGDRWLALIAEDSFDNVSRQRGPAIWGTVDDWLSATLTDVEVDLNSMAEDDDGRVLVWITLHGAHIGSRFPFMAGRVATGKRVAWSQVRRFVGSAAKSSTTCDPNLTHNRPGPTSARSARLRADYKSLSGGGSRSKSGTDPQP